MKKYSSDSVCAAGGDFVRSGCVRADGAAGMPRRPTGSPSLRALPWRLPRRLADRSGPRDVFGLRRPGAQSGRGRLIRFALLLALVLIESMALYTFAIIFAKVK